MQPQKAVSPNKIESDDTATLSRRKQEKKANDETSTILGGRVTLTRGVHAHKSPGIIVKLLGNSMLSIAVLSKALLPILARPSLRVTLLRADFRKAFLPKYLIAEGKEMLSRPVLAKAAVQMCVSESGRTMFLMNLQFEKLPALI